MMRHFVVSLEHRSLLVSRTMVSADAFLLDVSNVPPQCEDSQQTFSVYFFLDTT